MPFDALEEFNKDKELLLQIIVDENYWETIHGWVMNKSMEGFSKKQIYNILCELQRDVQTRPDPEERLYDRIADFLDLFTSWCKGSRILPNEPDVD